MCFIKKLTKLLNWFSPSSNVSRINTPNKFGSFCQFCGQFVNKFSFNKTSFKVLCIHKALILINLNMNIIHFLKMYFIKSTKKNFLCISLKFYLSFTDSATSKYVTRPVHRQCQSERIIKTRDDHYRTKITKSSRTHRCPSQ